MKDWMFFPLIMALAGFIIYQAFYWGGGPEPINPEEGYVVKGTELQYLKPSPGTFTELEGLDHAVMSADARADQRPSQGVFTTLGPDYAQAYQGRTLDLTVRAKSGGQNPSDSLQIAFLTVPAIKGRFGWRKFPLTSEYQDITIRVKLADFTDEIMDAADVDDPVVYFGIWPDPEGKGRTIHVKSYAVMPVSE